VDHEQLDEWAAKLAELSAKLATATSVQKAGRAQPDEPAEATLAHALVDIEEECQRFTNEYLPSVMNAASPQDLDDALAELHMGLRHLVYHVRDSPYLRGALD
jgi:hypothetical protein